MRKTAIIFGGTGFLGTQIVHKLATSGLQIKVATRTPESAYKLKTYSEVGQIAPVACDYNDPESISAAVKGSDIVINCIGISYEKGKKCTFPRIHVELPAMIAKTCMEEGVKRLVHISALGCSNGISRYAHTKLEGERIVLSHYPKATLLRPGVLFGADDSFFTMLAEFARYTPFMPLLGGGRTKFQPVYVGDVAEAVVKASDLSIDKYQGKTYQLGGPDIIDFKDIYALIFKATGRAQRLITIPFRIAKYYAWFMEIFPHPSFTHDQLNGFKTNNIVQKGTPSIKDFDIAPKSVNLIMPECLERFHESGRRAF